MMARTLLDELFADVQRYTREDLTFRLHVEADRLAGTIEDSRAALSLARAAMAKAIAAWLRDQESPPAKRRVRKSRGKK
jgi:hypothetical protein